MPVSIRFFLTCVRIVGFACSAVIAIGAPSALGFYSLLAPVITNMIVAFAVAGIETDPTASNVEDELREAPTRPTVNNPELFPHWEVILDVTYQTVYGMRVEVVVQQPGVAAAVVIHVVPAVLHIATRSPSQSCVKASKLRQQSYKTSSVWQDGKRGLKELLGPDILTADL